MKSRLLSLVLLVAPAAAAPVLPQDGDAPPKRTATDERLVALRSAFAGDYFAMKERVAADLAAAREQAGGDEARFAELRAEIARRYRTELADLVAAHVAKARAGGVALALPSDDTELERIAAAASPIAALRYEFAGEVAELTRAAKAELADARKGVGRDEKAFAARRTEIARKYRPMVARLQEAYATRAKGLGQALDTSRAASVLDAVSSNEPAREASQGRPPAEDAAKPVQGGGGQPINAVALRNAFEEQVGQLRKDALAELLAASSSSSGDELARKNADIAARYRGFLERARKVFAARAEAAGVTMDWPTDAELIPELDRAAPRVPAEAPKDKPGDEPRPPAVPPEGGDGEKKKEPERKPEGEKKPEVRPSEKPGRGPRWNRGKVPPKDGRP